MPEALRNIGHASPLEGGRHEPIRAPSEGSPRTKEQEELYRQCKEFEAILVARILRELRKTVGSVDFGSAEGIWSAETHEGAGLSLDSGADMVWDCFLDLQLARKVCQATSFGIAEALYRRLDKNPSS